LFTHSLSQASAQIEKWRATVRRPALFGSKSDEDRSDKSRLEEPGRPEPRETKSPVEATAVEESKASSPGERRANIRYLDRPDMAETFADSITGLRFDGQTLRIEFGVTRLDNTAANAPVTGRRYPACRLVLSPTAAVDLINRMSQIGAALKQAGVAREVSNSAGVPRS
jgi:hypothetical protein